MKNLIVIIAFFSTFFYSCTKDEITNTVSKTAKDTISTVITGLKFKINPLAANQFEISIQGESANKYKLYLKKGNQNLLSSELNEETNLQGYFSTIVNYNFSADDLYSILISGSKENTDTVFQEIFTIPEYYHQYYNKFNYETLTTINQRLDFDISPSRNVIYYLDYINNKCVLKRLSIPEKKLDVIDNDFFSLLIRAKSDNQLIVANRTYNNHFLGTDSCALLNYDVITHETSFLDWGSSDYGRFSRVVNHSIMVSNPLLTNTMTLIDLSDNSKRTYTVDIGYLRETSFDNIYLGNEVFDFSEFNFVNKFPYLNRNTSVFYFDDKSKYLVTAEYLCESLSPSVFYSRIVVYKDNKIVYDGSFKKGRSLSFPSILNLTDNKLVFYQYFDYDSELRFDGYYQLDLVTKQIVPLQYESDMFVNCDFFDSNNSNSFISIRTTGIFKVTAN